MKVSKINIVKTALFISVGLLPALNLSALDIDGGSTKDLIPIQRPIALVEPHYRPATVTPGVVSLKVSAWVDRENLTYHLGDKVKFYVKANKDCYITLIDIGTTGATYIIFPNQHQPNNFLKAGQTISIPNKRDTFDFEVTGVKGKEVVKVFATVDSDNLIPYDYLSNAGPYKSINTKDLAVVARAIDQYFNNPNEYREWDEYTKILTIIN